MESIEVSFQISNESLEGCAMPLHKTYNFNYMNVQECKVCSESSFDHENIYIYMCVCVYIYIYMVYNTWCWCHLIIAYFAILFLW